MRIVYKYPLSIADLQTIELPADAKILKVGVQGLQFQLWALVNPKQKETRPVQIRIAGTGHPIEDYTSKNYTYLNSVEIHNGTQIYHIFLLT